MSSQVLRWAFVFGSDTGQRRQLEGQRYPRAELLGLRRRVQSDWGKIGWHPLGVGAENVSFQTRKRERWRLSGGALMAAIMLGAQAQVRCVK